VNQTEIFPATFNVDSICGVTLEVEHINGHSLFIMHSFYAIWANNT